MSEGDRLFHSWRAGQRLPMAFLDDYAQMSRAALALFQETGNRAYLERACAWVDRCRADFHDEAGRGCFLSPQAADGPIVRPKNAHRRPQSRSQWRPWPRLPAALWLLTGDERYRTLADDILSAFAGDARENPAGHATCCWRRPC